MDSAGDGVIRCLRSRLLLSLSFLFARMAAVRVCGPCPQPGGRTRIPSTAGSLERAHEAGCPSS